MRAQRSSDPYADGRLTARPEASAGGGGGRPGRHVLPGPAGHRDAVLVVPSGLAGPAALAVLLHGAGGHPQHVLTLLEPFAESHGVLLLGLPSIGPTWDVLSGGFGPDVERLDALLHEVFAGYPVDRVAVGGFSDGASYALSVGIGNGELFDAVLAYSPGFMAPAVQEGTPRVYISHGTADRVLPVDRCSRRLVPTLEAAGYDVTYDEFAGPHTVPPDVVERSVTWWLGGPAAGAGGAPR
jgi:poly(3-hydroxybutyrate) depolymerase